MKVTAEEIQRRFPFFEFELTQDIVRVAEFKSFNKGDFILQTGQYIRSILLVFNGLVKVFRENGNGSHFFMHYLSGGDAIALTIIYDNKQEASEVSAVAFEETTLLAIPLSCMDKWMREYKSWYLFVFDTFKRRVQIVLNTVDAVVFFDTKERLISYLKRHKEVLHSKNIPITRTDIASEMNSSREVITRLLKKLALQGKLKMHRQYIELVDLD
jgi:CRP/FNR family transcriptional regulator